LLYSGWGHKNELQKISNLSVKEPPIKDKKQFIFSSKKSLKDHLNL